MVRVTIELVPHGLEERKKTIGMIEIANDGTGDLSQGNYDAEIKHAGMYFGKPGNWKVSRVEGHRRSLSPYHLVARVLLAAGIR